MDRSSFFPWENYISNKDAYEKKISNIVIEKPSKEKLTCCNNLIFNHNYYYKHEAANKLNGIDVEKNVYLRESILASLIKVDKFLRKNSLCLFVRNGYRSKKLQKAAISDWKKVDVKRRFSHSLHPPHSTGAAFDLEIFDIKAGNCLNTKNKAVEGIYPYQKLEKTGSLEGEWTEIRRNIRLLHNLLTKPYVLDEDEVFIPNPYEQWHFERGTRHAKFFSLNPCYKLIYDVIEEPVPCLQ